MICSEHEVAQFLSHLSNRICVKIKAALLWLGSKYSKFHQALTNIINVSFLIENKKNKHKHCEIWFQRCMLDKLVRYLRNSYRLSINTKTKLCCIINFRTLSVISNLELKPNNLLSKKSQKKVYKIYQRTITFKSLLLQMIIRMGP